MQMQYKDDVAVGLLKKDDVAGDDSTTLLQEKDIALEDDAAL